MPRSTPVNNPVEKSSQEQSKSQPRAKTENFSKRRQILIFQEWLFAKTPDSPSEKKWLVYLTQWQKSFTRWELLILKSSQWALNMTRWVTETGM